jgi:hypothetical protein
MLGFSACPVNHILPIRDNLCPPSRPIDMAAGKTKDRDWLAHGIREAGIIYIDEKKLDTHQRGSILHFKEEPV